MEMLSSHKLCCTLLVMLLLFTLCHKAQTNSFCSGDTILCEDRSKCVQIGYICDIDRDCGDGSDESFCGEWNSNGGCDRGKARCTWGDTCVSMKDFCSSYSSRCPTVIDPRICQMLKNGRLQRLHNVVLPTTRPTTKPTTKPTTIPTTIPTQTTPLPVTETNLQRSEVQGKLFEDTLNVTISHPECPKIYTRIGEYCLSLFYILKVGWGEARTFCEAFDGQLVSFESDGKIFLLITKHMRDFDLTADFWIGGRYFNETQGWQWLSGNSMELGSPFWAVRYENDCLKRQELVAAPYWLNKTACYHYRQAPDLQRSDMCTAITYRHYYYVTDEDCMSLKSPLCIYKGTFNSSSAAVVDGE